MIKKKSKMKVVSGNVSSVETHSTGKTTWPSILPLSMKGRCIYYVILAKEISDLSKDIDIITTCFVNS